MRARVHVRACLRARVRGCALTGATRPGTSSRTRPRISVVGTKAGREKGRVARRRARAGDDKSARVRPDLVRARVFWYTRVRTGSVVAFVFVVFVAAVSVVFRLFPINKHSS